MQPTFQPEPMPADDFGNALRRHLDDLNRQFIRVAHGLVQIDDGLREIIFDHLAEIGLDDINPNNRNK